MVKWVSVGDSMLLSKSHLYYIKKEKDRRARVISARLCRELGSGTASLYIKIIKHHMGLELNQRFCIRWLELMEDRLFPEYLEAVHKYRFSYAGNTSP
jgi:hypothetical protein